MRLTILGAGAVRPNPNGGSAGYLLDVSGKSYLIDCGFGVVSRLLTVRALSDLDGVFVSHTHPDHCADLVAIRMALVHAPGPELAAPIPVYALAESVADLVRLGDVFGDDFWSDVFEFVPVTASSVLELPGMTVRFAPTLHFRPCIGMRFEAGGRSLVYTADTGPSEAIASLAEGCDLLLAESTLAAREADDTQWGHLTAAEAGALAASSRAKRLVLTHYYPELGIDRLAQWAADAYGAPVAIAREGDTHDV